jgi:hypothetical protein
MKFYSFQDAIVQTFNYEEQVTVVKLILNKQCETVCARISWLGTAPVAPSCERSNT